METLREIEKIVHMIRTDLEEIERILDKLNSEPVTVKDRTEAVKATGKAQKKQEQPKKTRNKSTKKLEIDRGRVMELRNNKWSIQDIAVDLGCSVSTISRIIAEEKGIGIDAKTEAMAEKAE